LHRVKRCVSGDWGVRCGPGNGLSAEKAARGSDRRRYPSGNKFNEHRVADGGRPVAVDSLPAGVSPYGCLDMAGNVWQWCSSQFKAYPYKADDGREGPGDANRIMRAVRIDSRTPR
jgi:formylglycine-generating enzyme required for sulfatase activity